MTAQRPNPDRPNYIDWLSIYKDSDPSLVATIDPCDEQWLNVETTLYKFDDEDPLKGYVTTIK